MMFRGIFKRTTLYGDSFFEKQKLIIEIFIPL